MLSVDNHILGQEFFWLCEVEELKKYTDTKKEMYLPFYYRNSAGN